MTVCPKCGKSRIYKRGKQYLRTGNVRQQYSCNDCGYFWRETQTNPKEDFGRQTAKILLLDIENARMWCGVWDLGKQVIGMDQIIKDWFILGWSAKWLFDSEVYSDFVTPKEAKDRDDLRVMQSLWKLMDEATVIVGHNIKGHDIPKITTRFIYHRILPPSPFQILDTYFTIKPLGFSSNKLKYVNQYLGLKQKLKTDYQLWIDCENGSEKDLRYMETYCKGDIFALEEAFAEIRPYIKTGINLALHNHSAVPCCHACGSPDLTEKGYYYTSVSRFISYVCNHCGSYSRQRTTDLSIADKKVLLSPTAR